jgi:hypothetical protein
MSSWSGKNIFYNHSWDLAGSILQIFQVRGATTLQSSWSKGISETNLKLQIPCSKCMQQPCDWPVMSQADACTHCMHCPMISQADACSYCMGSVVLILSRIHLYSSYFDRTQHYNHRHLLYLYCLFCFSSVKF